MLSIFQISWEILQAYNVVWLIEIKCQTTEHNGHDNQLVYNTLQILLFDRHRVFCASNMKYVLFTFTVNKVNQLSYRIIYIFSPTLFQVV